MASSKTRSAAVDERGEMLRRMRAARRRDTAPLPSLDGRWLKHDDPAAALAATIEEVGGRCVRTTAGELGDCIEEVEKRVGARMVRVDVEGGERSGAADGTAAGVDLLVVGGRVGVAENGAIWVGEGEFGDRAALFLAQHLMIVLDRASVVDNMHEAYDVVDIAAGSFGLFISGPSKTADIEQALVIGAHGPRSLTVALLA